MKKLNLYLTLLTVAITCYAMGQDDPLAPAVTVVEDGVDSVKSITKVIIEILIGAGFVYSIYQFVTNNIKMGFIIMGTTAFLGTIIMAIFEIL